MTQITAPELLDEAFENAKGAGILSSLIEGLAMGGRDVLTTDGMDTSQKARAFAAVNEMTLTTAECLSSLIAGDTAWSAERLLGVLRSAAEMGGCQDQLSFAFWHAERFWQRQQD